MTLQPTKPNSNATVVLGGDLKVRARAFASFDLWTTGELRKLETNFSSWLNNRQSRRAEIVTNRSAS